METMKNRADRTKRTMALLLAILMLMAGSVLTGCGGNSTDLEEGGGSDVTLKQALEANPDAAWFFVKEMDKDADVKAVYYFEDGMVTRYDTSYTDLTLGQVGDMTKDELISASVDSWNKKIEKWLDQNDGSDSQEEFLREAWENFKKDTNIPADTSPALPYSLGIYTDSSGNSTESEMLTIPYMDDDDQLENDYDWITGIGNGIVLTENNEYWKFTYGGYMGEIYDSSYGGFEAKDGRMLITKASPETYFVFDQPGTEGIEVDPK